MNIEDQHQREFDAKKDVEQRKVLEDELRHRMSVVYYRLFSGCTISVILIIGILFLAWVVKHGWQFISNH